MKNYKLILIALAFVAVGMGCQDLEVENLNNPDRKALLATPSEFPASIEGSYSSVWGATQYSNFQFPISVMSQSLSMSWGNWGAQDLGTIPRQALQNNLTYNNRGVFTAVWNSMFSALGQVNGILKIIAEDGIVVPDGAGNDITQSVIANGKFIQGMAMGYLSLTYDQAYIVDETSDISDLSFSPYNEVNAAAIQKLEEAAALFAGSNIAMTGFPEFTFVGDDAAKVARSFAAKFEAFNARNSTEAAAIDWSNVLSNASNGMDFDLSPLGDGGNVWWHRLLIQGQDPGWSRTSQKMVKLMNPSKPEAEVPYPWPDGVGTIGEVQNPEDNRFGTDITFAGAAPFSSARGWYFYSDYDYSRYEAYRATFAEPMDYLTEDELGLIRAEALIRTGGSKIQAAGLINNTRVGRGGLLPLTGTESDQELLEAITYELLVETSHHMGGNPWFQRRMRTPPGNQDATNLYFLEPNTARHLPVPADELSIFGIPFYTFGGNQPEQ
mgnify:CR=1 FL=1